MSRRFISALPTLMPFLWVRVSSALLTRRPALVVVAPISSSHAFAPAADRLYGELGRVARDPDADEAGVDGHIVDAIGHDLAEFLVLEVMHVHPPWLAFRAIIGSAVLEVADQLLFLVSWCRRRSPAVVGPAPPPLSR
jgi:hypothetical protein